MTNQASKNILLFMCSYPPRQCGIATFSSDLIAALNNKFAEPFEIKICSLEEDANFQRHYPAEVIYSLNTGSAVDYATLARTINNNKEISAVCLQHEFGLFSGQYGSYLLAFVSNLKKPLIITFHSVLPKPDAKLQKVVLALNRFSQEIIVMTEKSKEILIRDYGIGNNKISVIVHGTHPLVLKSKQQIKKDLGFENRFVLSTFGMLGRDKNIETALRALPEIIRKFPQVIYLVLGQTHPVILKREGDVYFQSLQKLAKELEIENHVLFVNRYLELSEILNYLQATDIYLFTSLNPNQCVSGTLSYAMAAGCPVISTPICHASEFLTPQTGMIIDFGDYQGLARNVEYLLKSPHLREKMRKHLLKKMRASSWDNVAIAYFDLFKKYFNGVGFAYELPPLKIDHLKRLTTPWGILQFAKYNVPMKTSGYTLDDNARALIVSARYFLKYQDKKVLDLMETYLNFIEQCQQPSGRFLNYIDYDLMPSEANLKCNLEDSNGRAIWSLGYLISLPSIPRRYRLKAEKIITSCFAWLPELSSPRAMAFAIKGLFEYNKKFKAKRVANLIEKFAERLFNLYLRTNDSSWHWFEPYLTYANSILPEALLAAYLATNRPKYKEVAQVTFDYLISHIFIADKIKVISNKGWFKRGEVRNSFGEQPIDVAYMISALDLFFRVFQNQKYALHLEQAFSWFLGNNHLRQVVYNEVTGGCFDGLEEKDINLNQGAESTVCYLLACLITRDFIKFYKSFNFKPILCL
jgi:glycosyltransferase involved in cell wall biosynthesis/uncharacterized protein (DUF3820 family)